jgi:hypothetical protein
MDHLNFLVKDLLAEYFLLHLFLQIYLQLHHLNLLLNHLLCLLYLHLHLLLKL